MTIKFCIRLLIAAFICIVPIQYFKILLYKYILHYKIGSNVTIGFSIIIADKVILEDNVKIGSFNALIAIELHMKTNSQIKRYNYIKDVKRITLDENSIVLARNRFIRSKNLTQHGDFTLGQDSIITVGHYFDLMDDIIIGKNVVVAGIGTQFWTHGFDIERNRFQGKIIVGDNCYIGSKCLFSYGVSINSNNQIGMGTVVTKSIVDQFGLWVSQGMFKKKDLNIGTEPNDYSIYSNKFGKTFYRKKDFD